MLLRSMGDHSVFSAPRCHLLLLFVADVELVSIVILVLACAQSRRVTSAENILRLPELVKNPKIDFSTNVVSINVCPRSKHIALCTIYVYRPLLIYSCLMLYCKKMLISNG